MNELLNKALQGVDPTAPDAYWQIMQNLLALMPWWRLLALNLLWLAGGVGIAWWRGGNLAKAAGWSLLLGPLGWLIIWNTKPPVPVCTRCGTALAPRQRRCRHCGCAGTTTRP